MNTLISVDIQPEYEDYISFNIHEFTEYVNDNAKKYNDIIFLYNGYETLGMIPEDEYTYWLIDNGLDEDIANSITLLDKGYAFFRNAMDNNISEDSIVKFVKFMRDNNITDSRDLNSLMWGKWIKKEGTYSVRNLLKHSEDMIYIPDLMDFLEPYKNISVCGGGKSECLAEVEIALQALEKEYKLIKDFVY